MLTFSIISLLPSLHDPRHSRRQHLHQTSKWRIGNHDDTVAMVTMQETVKHLLAAVAVQKVVIEHVVTAERVWWVELAL